jgi:hypothetical protein
MLALASQLAVAADQKLTANPCKLDDTEVEGLSHDMNVDVLALREYAASTGQMLQREQFEKLDCLADQVRSTKERFSGGHWKLHELYRGVSDPVQYPATHATQEDWNQLFRLLEQWQTKQPKSITPRVALAQAYIGYAFDARGNGLSDSVSDSGWKLFEQRIAKARLTLEKAAALPVTCPEWYVAMLLVAQNQSWEISETRALYDEAERREPGYYYDARVFATYLLPSGAVRREIPSTLLKKFLTASGATRATSSIFRLRPPTMSFAGARIARNCREKESCVALRPQKSVSEFRCGT